MTLTVKLYSDAEHQPAEQFGELRWRTGGKVEVVSGGRKAAWFLTQPIMVGEWLE